MYYEHVIKNLEVSIRDTDTKIGRYQNQIKKYKKTIKKIKDDILLKKQLHARDYVYGVPADQVFDAVPVANDR